MPCLEGYAGRKTPFIRTPKFNLIQGDDRWQSRSKYLSRRVAPVTILEGLFLVYFGVGVGLEFQFQAFMMLPFHLLLLLGYGVIFFFSIRHSLFAGKG